jgi:hypothetical protein
MKKIIAFVILAAFVFCFSTLTAFQGKQKMDKTDSIEADKAKYIAILREQIKGKEDVRVDSVFKNMQIFRGMPAKLLLNVMDKGWSKALGVSCGHCHNTNDFASDEKPQKQIAREMYKMTGKINTDYLEKIKNLQSVKPIVNCTTCHRGEVKPALNLPLPPKKEEK